MTRIALLARFPTLRSPTSSAPVIPPGIRSAYPELHADFTVLDEHVAPAFRDSDLSALRSQNRYRRQQVTVLLGSVAAAAFGGLQAVFPEQRWPGIVLTVLGISLAASSRVTSEIGMLSEHLTERIKAERLRSLHFRFLAAIGRYGGADRTEQLRRAVVSIRSGEEPR